LLGNCGLESVFITTGNIGKAGDHGANVGRVELAGVRSSCCVWVAVFSVNSLVCDNVLEGLVHQTTIATLVSLVGGAVNEVLFGEGDQSLSGQEVSTFN